MVEQARNTDGSYTYSDDDVKKEMAKLTPQVEPSQEDIIYVAGETDPDEPIKFVNPYGPPKPIMIHITKVIRSPFRFIDS